jgi:3',5'-cyclic AMP phosphodiesterase CpdA
MTYSVSLAHLSDLHFGKHSRFKDKDPSELGKECALAIKGSMEKNFDKKKPDLVVVTGDITEQAEGAEFKQAGKFFKSLSESLAIPASCFVFMPGNHDVSREECVAYFEKHPEEQTHEYVKKLEKIKLRKFNRFVSDFYGDDKPFFTPLERGAALYQYESLGLVLVALNSSEQITDIKPTGTISKEQAQAVMDALDSKSYQIRIVALHHAMETDNGAAMAWISYLKEQLKIGTMSASLLDKLENSAIDVKGKQWVNRIIEEKMVHLVLYGHQHKYHQKPGAERWKDQQVYCQVCAAGSFGIKPEKTFNSQPNCIHLCNFIEKNERVQLNFAALEYDPAWPHPNRVAPGCFHEVENYYANGEPPEFPLVHCTESAVAGDVSGYVRQRIIDILEVNANDAPPDFPLVHCTESAVAGDVSGYVRQRIIEILEANTNFRTALAKIWDITDTPEAVACRFNDKEFAAVWNVLSERPRDFKGYFSELTDILFLMAQGAVSEEQIAKVREKLRATEPNKVIELNIRRGLMAELVLKTALEQAVNVKFQRTDEDLDVVPKNEIPNKETGIGNDKRESDMVNELARKWITPGKRLTDYSEDDLKRMVIDNLKAYFDMREPLFIVLDNFDPLDFPYLVQIIVPRKDRKVPMDSVTPLGEDYLLRLIYITLEKISKFQN